MRIELGEPYSSILECPICPQPAHPDYSYVHLGAVKVNRGGEMTMVAPEGEITYQYKPIGRGSEIVIYCWCEGGHTFELVFQFHKGQTFVRAIRDQDVAKNEDGSTAWPPELWRD